jgi:hypothetical protein
MPRKCLAFTVSIEAFRRTAGAALGRVAMHAKRVTFGKANVS